MRWELAENAQAALAGYSQTGSSTTKKRRAHCGGSASSWPTLLEGRTRDLTHQSCKENEAAVNCAGEPLMQGSGEVSVGTDDWVATPLPPSSLEERMSAVLLRLLFPATCGSALSWRLASSAAIRREETLFTLRRVSV